MNEQNNENRFGLNERSFTPLEQTNEQAEEKSAQIADL